MTNPKSRSAGKCRANRIEHFPGRRKHAHGCESAAVNHRLSVHEYLELAVTASHHLNLGMELATNPRRHPDGLQTGHSIRAVANGNAGHVHLRSFPSVRLDSDVLLRKEWASPLPLPARRREDARPEPPPHEIGRARIALPAVGDRGTKRGATDSVDEPDRRAADRDRPDREPAH